MSGFMVPPERATRSNRVARCPNHSRGSGRDEIIARALDAVPAAYIVKPFSPTEVRRAAGWPEDAPLLRLCVEGSGRSAAG